MYDIVEVAAQIGGMHSSNPIINWIYKLRKKKKLNDLFKRIDKLPEIPSYNDMEYFSAMIPKWYGMDIDGDCTWFRFDKIEVTMICKFCHASYIIRKCDGKETYRVTVYKSDDDIEIINLSTCNDSIQNRDDVLRIIGKTIKVALHKICTDLVLGGN